MPAKAPLFEHPGHEPEKPLREAGEAIPLDGEAEEAAGFSQRKAQY